MKRGLEDEKSFEELGDSTQKKTWVHTVLKGLIYGTMETVIRTAGYGTGHTWYREIDEVRDDSVKELWRLKEVILQAVADDEKTTVERLKGSRIIQLADTAFKMGVTVIDWDGAWKRRTKVALAGLRKHYEK
jgi:hypothetical protein